MYAEFEITCGHQLFSVCFIRVADRKYMWSVIAANQLKCSHHFVVELPF